MLELPKQNNEQCNRNGGNQTGDFSVATLLAGAGSRRIGTGSGMLARTRRSRRGSGRRFLEGSRQLRPLSVGVPLQALQVGSASRRHAGNAASRSFSSALLMMSSSSGGHVGIQAHRGTWVRVQNGFEDHCRACRRGTAMCRSPSRTAPRRRRTDRCAHPVPCPAPAPATCRPRCQRMVPGLVRCCSSIVPVMRVGRRNLAGRTGRRRDLRQTKIQNLGVPALGHEDVRGLDVAVDDAFGVGGVECVGNLDGQRRAASRFPAAGPRSCASGSRRPETPWR